MQKLILAILVCLISLPVSAEKIRMWRDENGKLHFGDAPPSTAGSNRLITTPENRTGVYGSGNDYATPDFRGQPQYQPQYQPPNPVDQAEQVRRRWQDRQDYEPPQRGLSYEDKRRLRELEMQKRDVLDYVRRNKPEFGESWVYEEEVRSINRQIRDIESRR